MEAARFRHLAVALAVILAAVSLVSLSGTDSTADIDDLPSQYPDADYIIADSGRSTVTVMYRTVHVPTEGEQQSGEEIPQYDWNTRTVSYGSSYVLTQLSELDGSLDVVMTGGVLGTLTLVQADVVSGIDPVDVTFTMVGGQLADLKVLSVQQSLRDQLRDSYTLMFSPLGNVDLDLRSGSIGDLIPTEDMVSTSVLEVTIGDGMTVDRMFTSGTNGRYGEVDVVLEGGSVGYMTNRQSLVGTLSYDLRSGTVEYLCLGADTEYGGNTYLSEMSTFYVQQDVLVRIDETVSVRQAIIGAGILDAPTVLWNGDTVIAPVAKSIVIEAPGTTVTPDTCFFTSNRTQGTVYQFSTYTVGGTPRTRAISTEYMVQGTSARGEVYGQNGVWSSPTDAAVPMGYSLYIDTQLSIPSGSTFTVEAGGTLVTAGTVVLSGSFVNSGTVINSGIIEKRDRGSYTGVEPEGDGFLAYCITLNPSGSIEVMASEDDTVILRTDDTVFVSYISVLLENGEMEVVIRAPESMYVGGDYFMIGLREVDVQGYDVAYELTIDGVDESVLSYLDISVTVPSPSGYSQTYYVYYVGQGDVSQMDVTDTSYSEVTFTADGSGVFALTTTPPDGTQTVTDSDGMDDRTTNIVLAAAIVIVGSVVVYILLRKD